MQRKALTPNDLATLDALAERLLGFGEHYRQIARPFEWTFTRQDLDRLLARIDGHEPHSPSPPNDQNLRTRLLVDPREYCTEFAGASPPATSAQNLVTKSTPMGSLDNPFNPASSATPATSARRPERSMLSMGGN